jgi:hypothetical protein
MSKNDINIHLENETTVDRLTFQKMLFIYNALNDGWVVKKTKDSYIFSKNHEGRKEVFSEDYLLTFMKDNFDYKKLLL